MVFSNLYFLFCFLPMNLLLYYLAPSLRLKNAVLIAFSLFFYAWGEPVWIVLLLFSATVDYIHGRLLSVLEKQGLRRLVLCSSLVLNLGLLIIFKYAAFIVTNINHIFATDFQVVSVSLPIGISFYTFQTISYVVDVYKGQVEAQKSYLKFLLFVSLFHQLVAGPIVRYKDIAREIEHRILSVERFNSGVLRFVTGLGKKVVIANTAGNLSSYYLDQGLGNLTVMGAWYGAILFTLQIYFDFSGYSDMAIGLGRMFGFTYKENFNYPYISRSATEFWRRWHISLGSFFRDYVYIPLGGNRKRFYFNIALVWFLTGLWHGASWNFILWGMYFGFFILIEKVLLLKWLEKMPRAFGHIYLLFIAVLGWVIFYYTDLDKGLAYIQIMLGTTGAALTSANDILRLKNNVYFLTFAFMASTPVFNHVIRKLKLIKSTWYQGAYVCGMMIICISLLLGQSYNPFLYFRF
jgi:alginate O-acetyltransferase complex protein AlgI